MTSHSFCPYGLESLLECITRAALLSQQTDVPNFVAHYLSEIISYRNLQPEEDPNIVFFNFQELWDNEFLKSTINAELPSPVRDTAGTGKTPASSARVKPQGHKTVPAPTVTQTSNNRPVAAKKRPPTPATTSTSPTVPAPTVTHTSNNPPVAAKKRPPTPATTLTCPTVPAATVTHSPNNRLVAAKKRPPTPATTLTCPTVPAATVTHTPNNPPVAAKKRPPTPATTLTSPTVPVPTVMHTCDLPPIAAKKRPPTTVKPLKCPTVPAPTVTHTSNRPSVAAKKRSPTPATTSTCSTVPAPTVTHNCGLPPIAAKKRPPTLVKPLKCPTVPAPSVTHNSGLPPIAAKKRPPTFRGVAGEETHAPHPPSLRLPKLAVPSHQKSKAHFENLKKRLGPCQDEKLLKILAPIYAPEDQVVQMPKKEKWNERFTSPDTPSRTRFPQISSNFSQEDMSSPDNTCPHSKHSTHIIRYKRVRVSLPQSGPDNLK